MDTKLAITVQSPIGPLTLYAHDGRLAAIDFSDHPKEETLRYMKKRLGDEANGSGNAVLLEKAEKQLSEYFSGKRKQFDLPLAVRTTAFQKLVLDELCRIPYGGITSYSEIAENIGYPKAFRAVGNANNHNPLPIVIPCHRVNARDGMLSGYAGGVSIKRRLQELEANALRLEQSTEIISADEILNPELTGFIRSFLKEDNTLEALETEAHRRNIPISKPETISLLTALCAVKAAPKILEIGTAIGYCAISLARNIPECHIHTMERDAEYAETAKKNIGDFGFADQIRLFEGDALELLKNEIGEYDLIYVDAAKAQYGKLFSLCRPLLAKRGILIFDNVLYKGITAGIQTVKHKNRTMVRNLQTFLTEAQNDGGFFSALVPTGDGVLILVKKENGR